MRFKKEVDVLLEKKGGAEMGLTWDKTNLAEIYWNKGKAEGKAEGKIDKQMLLKGYSINDIHELTGLPLSEIEKLKEQE
ncbi:MAG: hypothetical protein ACK4M9_04055 [Anaerobacillus sp.]|uniref:hypothetical protein n=1 Tax=Anaerobacillus sp. TaxID=1872506 RepID=UPI003919ACF9